MIAPRTPLLAACAALALPLAAVASFVPVLAVPCLATLTLAVVCAAWDAARGVRASSKLSVRLPAALRCTKDCEAQLSFDISNGTQTDVPVALALRLPATVAPVRETEAVLAHAGQTKAVAALTPSERGDYPISTADIERASPWGLWAVRTAVPVECTLRVYPNLRGRATRELFLAREMPGIQKQRQVGRGREFERLREYAPGDSFDEIYWKATARRGKPVVKVFQVERTQELYVVVDASRLSARAGVLERYVTAALHLCLAAQRQGDLFGLLTFSDKVHRFVRAGKGDAHYRACREAIYRLQSERVSPDFAELFTFIQSTLRRRALIVVLTALDDPVLAENFGDAVQFAARRHLVLANVVRTAGTQPLFEAAAPQSADDLFEAVAGQFFWKKLHELRRSLERHGVRLSVLNADRIETELTSLYIGVKQRQRL